MFMYKVHGIVAHERYIRDDISLIRLSLATKGGSGEALYHSQLAVLIFIVFRDGYMHTHMLVE